MGLPVPPGVCRPNEEFTFCEEDKSCEEQCLLGGKCQNNADVTCGKDSDCSTFGPCVMSGKCDMNPSKTCRSDNDCKDEDSCRDFAGKCQGQDVICAEDSHCGKDGSTKCIVGGVCSGGGWGKLCRALKEVFRCVRTFFAFLSRVCWPIRGKLGLLEEHINRDIHFAPRDGPITFRKKYVWSRYY